MAANHGRPLSTFTNHNSQVHFRPITQQHMVAEPIRTRDLKTRGLRPAPHCHPTEAVPNAWSLSLGAFEQSLGRYAGSTWQHPGAFGHIPIIQYHTHSWQKKKQKTKNNKVLVIRTCHLALKDVLALVWVPPAPHPFIICR